MYNLDLENLLNTRADLLIVIRGHEDFGVEVPTEYQSALAELEEKIQVKLKDLEGKNDEN